MSSNAANQEIIKKPSVFLAVSVVPQSVLLIINLNSFAIISETLSAGQARAAAWIFAAESALFLSSLGLGVYLLVKKRIVTVLMAASALIISVAYLWLITQDINSVIPSSLGRWIMSGDSMLLYQYMCIMPLVFYSVIRLASIETRFSFKKDITATVVVMVTPPLLWYSGMILFRNLLDMGPNLTGIILPILFIVGTVVMFLAMTRLLLVLYGWIIKRGRYGITVLYIIIGTVMPLGGLTLNRFIPFPVDFQSNIVYILTVLNGLFLAMPDMKNDAINMAGALGRFLFFPFTLYFFIVFLPFLPLSILAIIVAGAGFLIVTPSALFVLHARRLLADFRLLKERKKDARWRALFIGSFLAMPLLFTGEAILDRVSLRQSISYIYEADYRNDTKFHGIRWFVKRGLDNLRKQGSAASLPFLSAYYNWITFDNLVLPEKKIEGLYAAFFGSPPDSDNKNRVRQGYMDFLNFSGRGTAELRENEFVPSTGVVVTSIDQKSVSENAFVRTRLSVTMKNSSVMEDEFRTEFKIPDGVFVSGYWLHIGKESVPGRIFERTTALWVYRSIISTRRDPGLLYFARPGRLRLRVFPFQPDEVRITEIEFLYPAALSPEIAMGTRRIKLNNPDPEGARILLSRTKEATLLFIPKSIKENLPKVRRAPYLHLIVDRSSRSGINAAMIRKTVRGVLASNPEIRHISIDLVNFEIQSITGGIIPSAGADRVDIESHLKSHRARGGFCRDRAVKRILLTYGEDTKRAMTDKEPYLYFPMIVVLQDTGSELVQEGGWEVFEKLLPDVPSFCVYIGHEDGDAVSFEASMNVIKKMPAAPVALIRFREQVRPVSLSGDEWISLDSPGPDMMPDVFDPDYNRFVSLPSGIEIDGASPYALGMKGHALNTAKERDPSRSSVLLKESIAAAKNSGILNGSAAYIVVENSAQWKMLEQKEKQKLRNPESLSFTKTPEPSLLVLACLFLIMAALKKLRKILHNLPVSRPRTWP